MFPSAHLMHLWEAMRISVSSALVSYWAEPSKSNHCRTAPPQEFYSKHFRSPVDIQNLKSSYITDFFNLCRYGLYQTQQLSNLLDTRSWSPVYTYDSCLLAKREIAWMFLLRRANGASQLARSWREGVAIQPRFWSSNLTFLCNVILHTHFPQFIVIPLVRNGDYIQRRSSGVWFSPFSSNTASSDALYPWFFSRNSIFTFCCFRYCPRARISARGPGSSSAWGPQGSLPWVTWDAMRLHSDFAAI